METREERINTFIGSLPYANAARVQRDAQSLATMQTASLYSANMAYYKGQCLLHLRFSLTCVRSAGKTTCHTPVTWLFPLEYPSVDPIVHVVCKPGMEFTPRHLNVRASDGRVFMRRAFANITSSPPSQRDDTALSLQQAEVTPCCGFELGTTAFSTSDDDPLDESDIEARNIREHAEIRMVLDKLQSSFGNKPPLRHIQRSLPTHDAAEASQPPPSFAPTLLKGRRLSAMQASLPSHPSIRAPPTPPAAFVKGFRLSVLSQQKMQEVLGRAEAEEAALECERAAVEAEGKESPLDGAGDGQLGEG